MKIIAAVDRNWGIGKKGKLLVSIPEDMKFFREETYGKVVIMGRKTLESLPDRAGLSERTNIVITSKNGYQAKNATVCHSVEEAYQKAVQYGADEVYVIGGGSIYSQMLKWCDVAHITKVDFAYDADTYFPDLDADPKWKIEAESEEKTYFNLVYSFVKYVRSKW